MALVTHFYIGKSTTGVANAMIPAFTSFQYPPTLRTRAMGLTNFSAGFALISVPYIWLLVGLWFLLFSTAFLHFFDSLNHFTPFSSYKLLFSTSHYIFLSFQQKHVENFLPPLILGLCGLLGALVLFFIDDRTAMMMAAERTPAHNKKLMESQQQLGK